jgi:hypothetical protein
LQVYKTLHSSRVLGQERIEVVKGMVDALSGLEAPVIMAEIEVVIGGRLKRRAQRTDTTMALGVCGFILVLEAGEGMPAVVVFFDAECGSD